jgi:hypothetical protein
MGVGGGGEGAGVVGGSRVKVAASVGLEISAVLVGKSKGAGLLDSGVKVGGRAVTGAATSVAVGETIAAWVKGTGGG